jgi:hypothetical protein
MPKRRKLGRQAALTTESRSMASHEPPPHGDPSELGTTKRPARALLPTVSCDQASLLYQGEWVLMRVTGTDEQTHVPRGEVLLHSSSRKEISKAILRAHKQDPDVHLYAFPGGLRRLYGDELRTALAEAAARNPNLNARW